jgi:hypothetical protein
MNVLLSSGTINASSFINQPATALSVVPTGVTGMIYLDDGTNTLSGRPCYRRYNGVAFQDMS